jgi:hypothetical protein
MPFDNLEIGRVETRGRRKRARFGATPTQWSPASAPISVSRKGGAAGEGQNASGTQMMRALAGTQSTRSVHPEGRTGGTRAIASPTPIPSAPASAPISVSHQGDVAGEGQANSDTHWASALAGTPSIEIGHAETRGRRKRAELETAPIVSSPASAPISAPRKGGAAGEGRTDRDTQTFYALAGTPSNEIDLSETKGRRKRAVGCTTPTEAAPASAPTNVSRKGGAAGGGHHADDTHRTDALAGTTSIEIDLSETKGRRKRARYAPTPRSGSPASAPAPTNVSRKGDVAGEGQHCHDTQGGHALAGTIVNLVSLQHMRVHAITQKSRSDRSIESLIASSAIGFRIDAAEKQRKEVFAQAKAFRLSVEKGEGLARFSNSLARWVPSVLASAATRQTWDNLLDDAEKEMAEAAKQLPAYEFVKSVKGFGLVGLAAICAEARIPIGEYRTVSGFWKRMGLAVINGERQQRKRGKEDAEVHGYSPRRRSQVWQFFSDSMFRHQWVADKDEDGKDPKKTGKPVAVPAHPAGPYGEVYARRMRHTAPRIVATEDLDAKDPAKWSPGRCHNDARRVMSKAVLRDLWRVWNGLPPRGSAEEG